MLAYNEELKQTAKDEKLYFFKFEVDGRHVPTELITGEVAGGTKMEYAGALTRSQYKAFIKFYLKISREGLKDTTAHKKYVERLTAKREKQQAAKKRR